MSYIVHSSVSFDLDTLIRTVRERLPSGLLAHARFIRAGDEALLTLNEAASFARAVVGVRRASGAARHIARELCLQFNLAVAEIPRSPTGAPVWPTNVVGALTHDSLVAAAFVAKSKEFHGIGIDVEPSEFLGDDIADIVANKRERRAFESDPFGDKALFCIKEAVFKAVHPHDGVFLDFSDVNVDRTLHSAETCYGRRVQWQVLTWPRVLAVAWW